MVKFNLLIVALITAVFNPTAVNNAKSCDLTGDWNQVTLAITPQGNLQSLVFTEEDPSDEKLEEYSKQIHDIYYSGQGNLDISEDTKLSFVKNRISYNGTKLGKFSISDDCSDIQLHSQRVQENPDTFAKCKIVYRHENIIAIKQNKETVFYLRKDPNNPYFVIID